MTSQIQPKDLLQLPETIPAFLESYLPSQKQESNGLPFVTLTYAQSIDAKIAITGKRTTISHLETKTMTHYIRSKHDAILVGYKTAIIDDPKLTNRYNSQTIRPIIVDPEFKWDFKGSKLEELVNNREALPPIIVISKTLGDLREEKISHLKSKSGSVLSLSYKSDGHFNWRDVFQELKNQFNINSIMVEGGASIIRNLLLENELIDGLIVTVGSTYLGSEGVDIAPQGPVELKQIAWWRGQTDAVMAARLK